LFSECRPALAAPVEQKIHLDDCSLVLLRQVVGESCLSRLLRAKDHYIELVFFLDGCRMLDFESIFPLFSKSSLELSFVLGQRIPSLRYFFLCPWRLLRLCRRLALLVSLGWRLI